MHVGLWQSSTVFSTVSGGGGVPDDCVNKGLWPLPRTDCLLCVSDSF